MKGIVRVKKKRNNNSNNNNIKQIRKDSFKESKYEINPLRISRRNPKLELISLLKIISKLAENAQ